jgi:DNA-binding NtrC family response regulator
MPAQVFVVHQENEFCSQIVVALQAAGCVAMGFSSPMTALDAMDHDPRVKVLVTRIDFGEGMLNGAALARMLLIKRPDIKLVYIGRAENERHVTVEGPFLPHPVDLTVLAETVRGLLDPNG